MSNWQFSKSGYLARYVSRHNAMAYDSTSPNHIILIQTRPRQFFD
jgi:hypothetical protein